MLITPIALAKVSLQSASDNFIRANSTGLGANWTQIPTLTSLDVNANHAQLHAAGSSGGDYYSALTWAANQFSQATCNNAFVAGNRIWAVIVRCSAALMTFYAAGFSDVDFGDQKQRIWKVVNGVVTGLAVSGTALSVNDIVKLSVSSNNLNMLVNGSSVLTVSDSAIAAGSPGLFGHAASNDAIFGNWSGSEV